MKAIVTVIGRDRIGIIAEVCTLLAANAVNILDITQTILQENFTMMMLVDTSACCMPFGELAELLGKTGQESGLSIRIQRQDTFNAMHRI